MTSKSYTHRIIDAVDESALSMPAKALLRVMAHRADHRTGVGWHGQETLARWVGCSVRTVRDLMAELSRPDSDPVRIERRARFRRDGRGRTSDEWRLVLVADQPARPAGYSRTTNRQDVPVNPRQERRLTGKLRTTNRQTAHDQPAAPAGDPHRDPISDPICSAPRSEAAKQGPRSKPAKGKPAHPHAHTLKLHYVAELQRTRGTAPAFAGSDWSRAMRELGKLADRCGGDLEKAKTVITRGLADNFRKRVAPWDLAADATNILAMPDFHRAAPAGRGPKQPNSGWRPPVVREGEF